MAYLEKTYVGKFSKQSGQTKVFGSRLGGYNPEHTIGHIYYELWSGGYRRYVGATDNFRERMHRLIHEDKMYGVNMIVVAKYDNPKDRDDREVNEQLKSLPPRNARVQRNTWGQGYKNG